MEMQENMEPNGQMLEGEQQPPEEQQIQPMQFSEEEVQNLKEIFDLFDKQQVGTINIKDLEAIMQSL